MVIDMKHLSLLVFLSQLGLGVVLPLCGFVLLGVWLRQLWNTGIWLVILCAALGTVVAFQSLRSTLKSMERLAKDKKDEQPPLAYNEHD